MLAVSDYFITKLGITTWDLNIAYFQNQQQLKDQVKAAETEVANELDSKLLEQYHTQKLTRAQALKGQLFRADRKRADFEEIAQHQDVFFCYDGLVNASFMRCRDDMFSAMQMEFEDIDYAIAELGLKEDPEFLEVEVT